MCISNFISISLFCLVPDFGFLFFFYVGERSVWKKKIEKQFSAFTTFGMLKERKKSQQTWQGDFREKKTDFCYNSGVHKKCIIFKCKVQIDFFKNI